MLRIHFTGPDLARVRLSGGPDPMWEILLSLHMLRGRPPNAMYRRWRAGLAPGPNPASAFLLNLAPARGYSAEFLTPPDSGPDPAAAIETVLRTPPDVRRRDLVTLAAQGPVGPDVRRLAAGEPEALRRLGADLHAYFERALAPHWPSIRLRIDRDRATRARSFLAGGAERVLSTLHARVRWRPPILEVDHPRRQELRLAGRGLLLVPAVFCHPRPITLLDEERPPVLVYPVDPDPALFDTGTTAGRERGDRALVALVGRTRAAVLATIGSSTEAGRTTGELARLLDISPASASQHAAVLRDSGLVASHRDHNTTKHLLTELGRALLR